ncbi:nitric oxide reductase transcriptional regulator NorR [Candidatus Methylobacter oryzae]|uniref:Nitric oxide reductase transcriptional regulator NorR n=1 Tax=Candidatus Methylobacter oryzae TaxID=2497749 RepID=A0ABY3C5K5_9GAMM|nr:nitric oxide reductase transcriptional regulator NorR [Candidatus Methylobacter oryzae]TRW90303.1 nitric oxide reductase transcriptional regulator NorR [Candidatus Methylobacter oryzae]
MTTDLFSASLISIVADLSASMPTEQRYQRLLEHLCRIFPCDASALLKFESPCLIPLAVNGLSEDTLGRRFTVDEHPRLAQILASDKAVRFAADSDLPDPYDGLVDSDNDQLLVHDCMGVTLFIDGEPWGVLTLDALAQGTFDNIDPVQFSTFIGLAAATVKAAGLIASLEQRVRYATQTVFKENTDHEMIGDSECMRTLRNEISIVAPSELAVLILGETGVGKELVARRIHIESNRADQVMVYVNCAALPESIAESELFGHTKGAFSGATHDRIGKFELANGGTIFLDEIGELPLSIQAKLLRTLQNGEIQRVGSDKQIKVDLRVIAATNRNLQQEVAAGLFRPDLYHRLAVYPMLVPALRERGKDVLLLAGAFLEKNQQRLGIKKLRLDQEVKKILLDYHWPGNIRELEHLLSRAALKSATPENRQEDFITISPAYLDIVPEPPEYSSVGISTDLSTVLFSPVNFKEAVDEFQRRLIQQQLAAQKGNMAATARLLGLDRGNFHRLLKRLAVKTGD